MKAPRPDIARAAAAYDRMVETRPLKPPPVKAEPRPARSAAALALARDRRLGLLGDEGPS